MRLETQVANKDHITLENERKSAEINLRFSSLPSWRSTFAIGLLSLSAIIPGCGKSEASSNPEETNTKIPSSSTEDAALRFEGKIVNPGESVDFEPLPLANAFVRYSDPITRNEIGHILIYREDPTNNAKQDEAKNRSHIYYHSPFGGFIERSDAAPERMRAYPSIIQDIDGPYQDGSYAFELRYQSSSPQVRELCRLAVVEDDGDYALQNGKNENEIIVNSYPLTHAFFWLRHTLSRDVLGYAESGELKSAIEIPIRVTVFSSEKLQEVFEGIAENRIELVPFFQAKGARTVAAMDQIKGSRNVEELVTAKLNSSQVSKNSPLFRGDKQRVMQSISEDITKKRYIEDDSIAARLKPQSLEARLFVTLDSLSMEDLAEKYPEIAARFNAYIKPHLESLKTNLQRQNIDIHITEHIENESRSKGGGFSFMGFGSKGSKTLSTQDLERLEEISGVRYERVGTSSLYRPHRITLEKLREGWQSVAVDYRDVEFLRIGKEQRYLPDTPIPLNFTQSKASAALPTPREVQTQSASADDIFKKILVRSSDGKSQVERTVVTISGQQYAVLAVPVSMAEVRAGKSTPVVDINNDARLPFLGKSNAHSPNLRLLLRIENSEMSEAEKASIQLTSTVQVRKSSTTTETGRPRTIRVFGDNIRIPGERESRTTHTTNTIKQTYLHNSLVKLRDYPLGHKFSVKNESGRTAVISIYLLEPLPEERKVLDAKTSTTK